MAEGKNWRKQFLTDHPYCCFCGGETPAVEPDHQPGRVFFRDREWPAGFVFPSCENCNRASRVSENVVSLLTSYFDDDQNRKKYLARRDSIRKNHPQIIDSLKMSGNELRRASKRIGMAVPLGQTYASLPIAKIDPIIWLPHFKMIGKKLAMGLHYQCLQRPLGRTGVLWLSFSTNADLQMGHDLNDFLESAPELVLPMRNTTMLGDQFAIRYGASVELGASLFVISLQKRLVITALCVEDPSVVGKPVEDDWAERPFEWR